MELIYVLFMPESTEGIDVGQNTVINGFSNKIKNFYINKIIKTL